MHGDFQQTATDARALPNVLKKAGCGGPGRHPIARKKPAGSRVEFNRTNPFRHGAIPRPSPTISNTPFTPPHPHPHPHPISYLLGPRYSLIHFWPHSLSVRRLVTFHATGRSHDFALWRTLVPPSTSLLIAPHFNVFCRHKIRYGF